MSNLKTYAFLLAKNERFEALLHNRLVDILKGLTGTNPYVLGIKKCFAEGGKIDDFCKDLKQGIEDSPEEMCRIIGGEAMQIISELY